MASPWSTGNRSSCSSHRTEAPTVRLSIAARRGLLPLVAVALATGAAAWWSVLRAPVPAPAVVLTRPADATALTDDAIRLYAAGQLARACDRFSEAAGERPDSAARREDVGRCFETWGWRTLAQGRPEEAALLFGQGLAAVPDDPALLKAAGVAAVHAGRVDADARRAVLAALETARRRVVAQLGDAGPEPVSVVLYERGQFSDVTGSHAWVNGLFDGRIRLPLGPALPARGELARLLTHEYAHAVIHHRARGRAPRWLQEGLAQVLEGRAADPALAASGGLTLSGLEALVTDPDPRWAHAGYELALFVVADLLDRGGMESMRALLARLGAGETIADAAPRVYGWRLAELESQWRRLLGG